MCVFQRFALVLFVACFSALPAFGADRVESGYEAVNEPLGFYENQLVIREKELAENPADRTALLRLLALYKDRGIWEAGMTLIDPEIERNPNDQILTGLLVDMHILEIKDANIFQKIGAGKDMRDTCLAMLERAPDNAAALLCLTRFYFLAPGIAGGNNRKGRVYLDRLEAIDRAVFHRAEAEKFAYDEEWTAAANSFVKSIETTADNKVLVEAGMYHALREEWEVAFDYLRRSFAVDPDYRFAQYQMGRFSALSGKNLKEGEAALIRLLNRPSWYMGVDLRPDAHLHLAEIYRYMGKLPQARKAILRALELDPKYRAAKRALKDLDKRARLFGNSVGKS